ncbi:hypothetical protein NHQ30_008793 [Ciborinia camelliae]|nr:hypothetical protein NHQ30_008793 [Ciborinia camelliae]
MMSTFPQFGLLPVELQLHIWHLALEVQEGHIVPIENLRYGRLRKFKPHVLYFVNCDSRRTYLEFHKKNLARYPRLGVVVFDPRIDTVLLRVRRRFQITYSLMKIGNGMESSIMKDVHNFAIGGLDIHHLSNFYGDGITGSTVHTIARVLSSVRSITYVAGDEDGGTFSERRRIIGLAKTLQGNMPGIHQSIYDLLGPVVETTCERLKEFKRRENPEWKIPRVQAMFAIMEE